PYPAGSAASTGSSTNSATADFELRAFVPSLGVPEDPVTGSLNAGVAQWLISAGFASANYVASQGCVLGRAGRVHINSDADEVWVGGVTTTCIHGKAIF
ncbi:MAG: PhzF family phenazine biosynthesis protein, partial [Congregibacter sp.]|nr:PhzF family phenazine biosynthesis protein [Congregibacter sp.]